MPSWFKSRHVFLADLDPEKMRIGRKRLDLGFLLGRHAFVEDYESKRSAVGVSRCRSDYCGRVRRIIAVKPERDVDFLRHGQIGLFPAPHARRLRHHWTNRR